MKYYIIAGEASGDLHGSNLIKSIRQHDAEAEIRCWGGELMEQAGATLVKHYRDLAFMGFWEVITNLSTIFKNITFCKNDIEKFNPDALIFIDYPGFNMRIAKWAKAKNIATHYYISPQIWAWKEGRIKSIKRDIDFMYVILPFEKQFYEEKHNFPVHFVGHPLLDAIENRTHSEEGEFRNKNNLSQKPIIALLPGSRKQEISKMLSVMLKMIPHFPDYQFVVAGAPSQEKSFYEQFIKETPVVLVENQTYDLLHISQAALVTSGTATLETALYQVPEVVCYKGNYISYVIAKNIVQLDYISLVNLIMNREVVTELIQRDFNENQLKKELSLILKSKKRDKIIKDYKELIKKLGGKGASDKTAKLIVEKTKTAN
ncbi:MAG: lipid-A-disaccharide synthase [Bacteroidota bacterium]